MYWTLPATTVGATSSVLIGAMTVPAGSTVSEVRLGVRRTDDVADAGIVARATERGNPPNTVSTSLEGPELLAIPTMLTAGQRIIFEIENTTATPRTVVGLAGALIRVV